MEFHYPNSNKSVYIIDTTTTKEINGVMYETKANKLVNINFSETNYTVKARMDKIYNDIEVEFIPESMDFLHKLTDIFPLSEYSYKIIRPAKKIEEKPFITIELQVIEKATGTRKWLGGNIIVLSDKDYAYFRNILMQKFPDHEWKSGDEYVRFKIAEHMNYCQFGFAADAANILIKLVVTRYKEVKSDGWVNFYGDEVDALAMDIVTKAITEYSEKEKAKEGENHE